MQHADTIFNIITLVVLLFSLSVFVYKGGQWIRKRHITPGSRAIQRARGCYTVVSLICVTLVGLVVLSPLIDLAMRAYFETYGTREDRIRYIYSEDQIKDIQSQFVGRPYIGFGLSPHHPDNNSLGYRGPKISQAKPPGVYRIAALGGSTTYGFGLSYEDSYPAQLQQVLREDYGYEQVEVINAGVQSYTTWESLVNFQFHVLDLDPDLIIVYHATNDITARLVHPDYYTGLNLARGLWQTSDENLSSSVLLRYIGINLGWMEDPLALESKFTWETDVPQCDMWTEVECLGYDVETLLELNPPIYFERNLRNMVAVAQTYGVQVMFSSWAYFPDTTPVTNIYTFPWRRRAVAQHNAIAQQIAQETSAVYYDLAADLEYNRAFWFDDGYHQSPSGAHEQARLYAAFIVGQGWLDEPGIGDNQPTPTP
ncbi:MAG: hypothetical protein JXJ20_05485 [Anaerolineae bacterium]|nr:hypothetical protein [Anaerolineae bacterium]